MECNGFHNKLSSFRQISEHIAIYEIERFVDIMSGWLICTQFSIFMGAVFSIFLLRIIPQSTNSYYFPAEIAPPRTIMDYALDRELEASFG
ncbi:hypothetical protein YC2023_114303 [Brassica napus]